MLVILTGPSGFVGQNLYPFLTEKGFDILPLSLRGRQLKLPYQYDAIIHLAGKAHDTGSVSEPQEYFEVNTELTKQVFDNFLQSDSSLLIYFSSVKAVADTLAETLNEDTSPAPKTPYGQSKLLAEEYILSQPLPEGKRVFILRPCMIHGPGNKGNLNLLYNVVKKGIPYPLAAFQNRRSFLSIQNLLFIIERLLCDPSIPGGVYNVADDEPMSTTEMIRIMCEAMDRKARIWPLPQGLLKSIARAGDSLSLPLNSERLKKLTESYVVSNQKIKTALKVQSLPVSSRQGLFETIKSFEK